MATKPSSPRYYQSFRGVWKQRSLMLPIVIMFIVTVVYASGLQNHTVRTVLLYMSLVYPAIIIFPLLLAIPKINYFQLDSDGIHVTILGFIRKHIYWSDIGSIGKAAIGNVEGIGLMYKPSLDRYVFGRKSRRKMFGWDEILADAHRADGVSLLADVVKQFEKYSTQNNR